MQEIVLRHNFHWKAALPYLAVAGLAAAYLYPFTRMVCQAPDAGVFLNGADLLTRGFLPSRDFVEPQGPGSFVWLALCFRLFGSSLATARAVLIATGVATGLLAFHISRRLGAIGVSATLFVVTLSVPQLPINSPHYDSNLLAFLALAFFLIAWDQAVLGNEPPAWPLVAAGVCCGITTTVIQQKGICLILGMLLSLGWLLRGRARRSLLLLALPFTALALLPFFAFACLHALPDLLLANYFWPLQSYDEFNAAPYAFPLWREVAAQLRLHVQSPWLLTQDFLAYAPFLTIPLMPFLLPLAARFAGRKWVLKPLLPYWLVAYGLWFGELHRLDIGHLRHGVMLMAVLLFSICEASGRRFLRHAALAASALLLLSARNDLLQSLKPAPVVQTRRGPLPADDSALLLQFLQTHTRAGDQVFVYPYQPLYYFVEDLRNPTRFSYLLYHFHTGRQFQEATLDLDRKKVRLVIVDRAFSAQRLAEVFPAYRHPAPTQLIMEPYLDAHYQLLSNLGRFQVLQRKPD